MTKVRDAKKKSKQFDWWPMVNVKRLGEYTIPAQAKKGSIGYDLYVPTDTFIPAHSRCTIPLNFAIELPRNVEGKIEPRSGFSIKGIEGLGTRKKWIRRWGFLPWRVTESGLLRFDADVLVGKIDPGYKDNVNVILKNNDVSFVIRKGTRIAQLSFYRVLHAQAFVEVEELTGYDRGGGLGHTGTSGKVQD